MIRTRPLHDSARPGSPWPHAWKFQERLYTLTLLRLAGMGPSFWSGSFLCEPLNILDHWEDITTHISFSSVRVRELL